MIPVGICGQRRLYLVRMMALTDGILKDPHVVRDFLGGKLGAG